MNEVPVIELYVTLVNNDHGAPQVRRDLFVSGCAGIDVQ